MYQAQERRLLTAEAINSYSCSLHDEEKSVATIQKYIHDICMAAEYFDGMELTKAVLIEWKDTLVEKYTAATVNTILAALNGFFKFMGWNDLAMKPLKIQRSMFSNEDRELTYNEYKRLVYAAESTGNRRLSLVVQTICATGIRVSELQFITVKAVCVGRTEIVNKGKRRTIFLPNKLRRIDILNVELCDPLRRLDITPRLGARRVRRRGPQERCGCVRRGFHSIRRSDEQLVHMSQRPGQSR